MDEYSQPIPEGKSSIRKIPFFIIVAFALLMTTVDSTIIATALETIQSQLRTSINWTGWTLTAYAFGFVLMLPISGTLSERYGHRKVFLLSVITFTVMSFLCGLASNIYVLILFRVIQAIGGAGITPSVTGLIVANFGNDRDKAVGLFGSVFPIGAMLGPVLGGVIVTYLSWRWIFFVNIPIGIIVVFFAYQLIPKDEAHGRKIYEKLDWKGILFLAIGILSAMFGASYLGEPDSKLSSPSLWILFLLAIVGCSLFIKHIKGTTQPLILPRIVYGKYFGAVNLVNIIYTGAGLGVIALIPLYANVHLGISPLHAGLLLVAQGIAAVILSTVVAFMLRKVGYHLPLYIGCSLIICGIFILSFSPQWNIPAFWWLSFGTFLVGAGTGTISPPNRNAGLQLAPGHSSTLAALRSMGIQLGSIIAIAAATAMIARSKNDVHIYHQIFLMTDVVLVIALLLIRKVPEHKGAW